MQDAQKIISSSYLGIFQNLIGDAFQQNTGFGGDVSDKSGPHHR